MRKQSRDTYSFNAQTWVYFQPGNTDKKKKRKEIHQPEAVSGRRAAHGIILYSPRGGFKNTIQEVGSEGRQKRMQFGTPIDLQLSVPREMPLRRVQRQE